MSNRSELIVDVNTIVNNYKIFCSTLKKEQKIIAIVKANAYGHGAVQVVKALEKAGCTDFGVACIEEAINLRDNGIKSTILVLGYTPARFVDVLQKLDIHQTVVSKEHLSDLVKTGVKVPVHFKIDTGMHRIGFAPNRQTENYIRSSINKLSVKGIYTHLCVADDVECDKFTNEQLVKFKNFIKSIQDLNLPYVHCFNSAGAMYYNDGFSTHVRLGIALYGLKPDWKIALPKGVFPAIEWRAEICMVKKLKRGESLGYGLTFTAEKNMKIATVTIGYADGYSRKLSNIGTVYVNEKKAQVVGNVCMDQLMIDVTGIKVKMGDNALLICNQYTADDMAKDLDTISYEVVTQISTRVTRVFK